MGELPPQPQAQPGPPQGPSSGNVLPVLAHVLGLFTGFVGPLVIYLTATEDPSARRHAAAALNWQLSLLIYSVAAAAALIVAGFAAPPLLFLLFVVIPALLLADLVMCLIGAVKAGNGEHYTYVAAIPFTRPA